MNKIENLDFITESFSLRSDGKWDGSTQLIDKVKELRNNNNSNTKACGTSVASFGDKGGACNFSGWGD